MKKTVNAIYFFNVIDGRISLSMRYVEYTDLDFHTTMGRVHNMLGGDEIGGIVPHSVEVLSSDITLVHITDDPNHEFNGIAICAIDGRRLSSNGINWQSFFQQNKVGNNE